MAECTPGPTSTIGAAALLFGVPFGIVVGRWVWILRACRNCRPRADPAWLRQRTATVLRSE